MENQKGLGLGKKASKVLGRKHLTSCAEIQFLITEMNKEVIKGEIGLELIFLVEMAWKKRVWKGIK